MAKKSKRPGLKLTRLKRSKKTSYPSKKKNDHEVKDDQAIESIKAEEPALVRPKNLEVNFKVGEEKEKVRQSQPQGLVSSVEDAQGKRPETGQVDQNLKADQDQNQQKKSQKASKEHKASKDKTAKLKKTQARPEKSKPIKAKAASGENSGSKSKKTKESNAGSKVDSDAFEMAAQIVKMLEDLGASPEAKIGKEKIRSLFRDLALIDPVAINENLYLALRHSLQDSGQLIKASKNYAADLGVLLQKTMLLTPEGSGNVSPVISQSKKDKRFRNKSWEEVPYFSFLKQNYLLWTRFMEDVFMNAKGLEEEEQKRVNFYVKQLCDALSPSNIPWMNPDALEKTFQTGGQNILQGLENLYRDFEKGKGRLDISMVDADAFKLGENIATTPGKVIFQNDLMQLIQYEASTDTVFETPILIIPPCINKYYVFDLRPENSFVRWLRDQGFTVFIISWVNPTQALAQKSFEDYVLEGVIEAAQVATDICNTDQVNALGFCIGGNFLAVANAYAAARGKKNPFKSATYLATLFDFSRAGDLSVFLGSEQLEDLEDQMRIYGFMDGEVLKRTFNMLRANDLIWSFVINNYFLGDKPSAFDFLYWNSDSTNLPASMYTYYLRKLFFENQLMKPNALSVKNIGIDLGRIKTPTFLLNTIEDHIAPWKSGYAGMDLFGSSDKTFVLAGSGHVVGIFNPPEKNKYSFFENDKTLKDADAWLGAAREQMGSWWTKWFNWVDKYTGRKIPARKVGSLKFLPIEDAPGSYVKNSGKT